MTSEIEFERYVANTNIFGIIISKLYYKKKPYSIILFKINKSSNIDFYYNILIRKIFHPNPTTLCYSDPQIRQIACQLLLNALIQAKLPQIH